MLTCLNDFQFTVFDLQDQKTLLHVAAECCQSPICALLVTCGIEVDSRDKVMWHNKYIDKYWRFMLNCIERFHCIIQRNAKQQTGCYIYFNSNGSQHIFPESCMEVYTILHKCLFKYCIIHVTLFDNRLVAAH